MFMTHWPLAMFTPIKSVFLGMEEERRKDKISRGLSVSCISPYIMQINKREEIPSCQQFLVSTTAKENNVI